MGVLAFVTVVSNCPNTELCSMLRTNMWSFNFYLSWNILAWEDASLRKEQFIKQFKNSLEFMAISEPQMMNRRPRTTHLLTVLSMHITEWAWVFTINLPYFFFSLWKSVKNRRFWERLEVYDNITSKEKIIKKIVIIDDEWEFSKDNLKNGHFNCH